MGFWTRVLGGEKKAPEADRLGRAKALLQNAEQKSIDDAEAALRALRHDGKAYRAELGLGGPLHEELVRAWGIIRVRAGRTMPVLPKAEVLSWGAWDTPRARDLFAVAERTTADVVYLTPRDPREDAGAIEQLEALEQLTDDSSTGMVLLAGGAVAVRRGFLEAARATVRQETTAIVENLSAFANANGWTVRR